MKPFSLSQVPCSTNYNQRKILEDSVGIDILLKGKYFQDVQHMRVSQGKISWKEEYLFGGVSMGYQEFRLLTPVDSSDWAAGVWLGQQKKSWNVKPFAM